MPETCEYWLGLVNRCVCYTRHTRGIYEVLPNLVNSKAPGGFEINRQFLVNFGIKDLSISEMTVKPKSNLHIWPVKSFDTVKNHTVVFAL